MMERDKVETLSLVMERYKGEIISLIMEREKIKERPSPSLCRELKERLSSQ
jgi:hypothetical protein